VEITNRLAYWFLDRYFERAAAFLQRHRAPLPPHLRQEDPMKPRVVNVYGRKPEAQIHPAKAGAHDAVVLEFDG
jgi:hypothetical protein